MANKGTRNLLLGLALLLCVGAVAIFVRPSLFPASLTGFFLQTVEGEELEVRPRSLSLWVDATGMLRATTVQNFSAPPEFGNYWQFQLVSMVAEGKSVKKGDLLVSFDAQKVKDDLLRFQNELDQAAKELERTRVQIDLERQELTARLAEAETKHEKSKLKQEGVGVEIVSARQVELDRLAVEQAKREVEALKERIDWHQKSSEATFKIIASKKTRAENKVNEIKRGIENFDVRSDREGVVVYKLKWNGERYQVGESCWSGMPVLEIPDLNTILVEAFVPEVDVGKIRIGQRAEVTIDAFPGKTYNGKVTDIGTLVRSKAWDIPNKILEARILLDRLDTTIMRPAMSIKSKIETGLIPNVLAVPLKAVHTTTEGSMVRIRTAAGWQDRHVRLGQSNGIDVVIQEGLNAGDRIASDYSKAKQKV
jgi:HlyD family secretion protein